MFMLLGNIIVRVFLVTYDGPTLLFPGGYNCPRWFLVAVLQSRQFYVGSESIELFLQLLLILCQLVNLVMGCSTCRPLQLQLLLQAPIRVA
ncbi:hypothetical protein GE061_014433 [Apolygus lucorum]|uniref:Uncharacterized protein n=1 Tax=Apolygus lucorum TaxID=248454 RepID=A0A8S9XT94_APOLU|nr:hypothetical protein GE061_014433 [Apolygus lucorum]